MTGTAARITEALADLYTIEDELGQGGMATVYLAHDPKHDRPVAVKVLRPELGAVLGSDRFLNEIKVTANLQHPHILPLFDSGEAYGQDGSGPFLYYVVPLIQGGSLRDRLQRENQLSLEETLKITEAVAGALEHAHRQNVIHRDIKPENILLQDGVPLVADFGIALAVKAAGGERLTETGLSLGTPAYMSPEQVSGDRAVDSRSDIYSLACMVYEMLAGDPPFVASTAQAVLARHITDTPPPITTVRSNVTAAAAAALAKALEKVPADRFETATEFAAAMRTEVTAVAEPIPLTTMPVSAAPERTPFVGRDNERAELWRRLDSLDQGQGGMVLVGGEPGVGKTRLSEEVLNEARKRNMMTLVGHCYEMEGAPPFNPFVEMLEYTSRAVSPEAFRTALGDAAPEVAKIMPGLRRLFPDIPPPLELPPEQARQYLFKGYREFIERASRVRPMVVLFDDLHWADEPTLLLVQHLAQHLSGMPVLAIGTYRDVELDVDRPYADTLEMLTRQRLAHRISLRRFPENEVADLLRALGGAEPPSQLVQAIHHETEGNPFFVEEVFEHLSEEGQLFDEAGQWRTDLRIDELDVPEGVRLVIGRRLKRLSDECRKVLGTAAVIGRKFDLSLLEELHGSDGDELLDAIEEAERARLIVSESAGRETRYAFVHELIRGTLVGALSLPRRQRLHLRVADAMERAYGSHADDHASDLAFHLYQAGAAADEDKTLRFLLRASKQALDGSAYEEALAQVDRALSIREVTDDKVYADLRRDRGSALRGLGRWRESQDEWEAAVVLYEQLDERAAVVSLAEDLFHVLLWMNEVSKAADLARRGLAAAGDEPSADRAGMLGALGVGIAGLGDYEEGIAAISEGAEFARESGDRWAYGMRMSGRAMVSWWYGRIRDVVEFGREAADAFHEVNDQWEAANVLGIVQRCLLWLGRRDAALALSGELDEALTELGNVGAGFLNDSNGGLAEFASTADFDSFDACGRRIATLWKSAGPWSEFGHVWVALAAFGRGDWDAAIQLTEEAMSRFDSVWFDDFFWGWRFQLKAYRGDDDALAFLDEHIVALPKAGEHPWIGARQAVFLAIDGLAQLGERRRAADLYAPASESVEVGYVVDIGGVYECYLGTAAAAGEQWDLAERHFETALRQASEFGLPIAHPETRRWYAWMLLDRDQPGDEHKATTLLDEAVEMYKVLGMVRHVGLAEELRRR